MTLRVQRKSSKRLQMLMRHFLIQRSVEYTINMERKELNSTNKAKVVAVEVGSIT